MKNAIMAVRIGQRLVAAGAMMLFAVPGWTADLINGQGLLWRIEQAGKPRNFLQGCDQDAQPIDDPEQRYGKDERVRIADQETANQNEGWDHQQDAAHLLKRPRHFGKRPNGGQQNEQRGQREWMAQDDQTTVRDLPNPLIEPPPPIVGSIDSEYIQAVVKLDDRLLILLDLQKLLSGGEARELEGFDA